MTVRYFGYGANRDADMMQAMVGRKPTGVPAVLEDFELCIEEWDEIPAKVKKILFDCGWDTSFKTYCARKAQGKKVNGTLWILTPEEHALVGNWEMHNLWFEPIRVVVKDAVGTAFDAETEIINHSGLRSAESLVGSNPYPYVVDKHKILAVASKVRIEFLTRPRMD